MKLNNDCIRDILFTVEDNTGYNEYLIYPADKSKCTKLNKYDVKVNLYHILQCEKAGLIEANQIDLSGNIMIKDLTPYGHEFIGNIREDNNWNKVKKIANEVGTSSLEAIKEIAVNVISSIISSKFL